MSGYRCHARVQRVVRLSGPRSADRTTGEGVTVKRPERCDTPLVAHGAHWWCLRGAGDCGLLWTDDAVRWAADNDSGTIVER